MYAVELKFSCNVTWYHQRTNKLRRKMRTKQKLDDSLYEERGGGTHEQRQVTSPNVHKHACFTGVGSKIRHVNESHPILLITRQTNSCFRWQSIIQPVLIIMLVSSRDGRESGRRECEVRREKGYQGTNDPTRASVFHHVHETCERESAGSPSMRRRWETMKNMLMFSLSLSPLFPI